MQPNSGMPASNMSTQEQKEYSERSANLGILGAATIAAMYGIPAVAVAHLAY